MDVSVIIPVFNEEKYLEQCLDAFLSYFKAVDFECEVIIIDNGSTDSTPDILKKYSDDFSVHSISRSSISFARNFGVSKSKGEVLAFIDGDVVINNKWIETLDHFVKFGGESFLTGYEYLVRPNPSFIEKYWFANLSSVLINGGNLILSKSVFDALNGFDVDMITGEDYDLCIRAKKLKFVNYCPDRGFEAVHLGYPSTMSGFMKREIWHGEGDFSSFKSFISSKVAVLSFLYIIIQLAAAWSLAIGSFRICISLLVLLLLINLAVTLVRFNKLPWVTLFFNNLINYLYFISRFLSFFQALAKKGRNY